MPIYKKVEGKLEIHKDVSHENKGKPVVKVGDTVLHDDDIVYISVKALMQIIDDAKTGIF